MSPQLNVLHKFRIIDYLTNGAHDVRLKFCVFEKVLSTARHCTLTIPLYSDTSQSSRTTQSPGRQLCDIVREQTAHLKCKQDRKDDY